MAGYEIYSGGNVTIGNASSLGTITLEYNSATALGVDGSAGVIYAERGATLYGSTITLTGNHADGPDTSGGCHLLERRHDDPMPPEPPDRT